MNIDLQVDLLTREKELRHFVECRVDFALGVQRDEIGSVRVHIGTVHEACDGRDKACKVSIELPGQPEVVVENHEANAYIAIHRAVDRAGWTVARQLMRTRCVAAGRLVAEQDTRHLALQAA